MEENQGKNLEVDMKKDLLEKIRNLQQEKREEKNNENIDIELFENCDLQIGKNKLRVSIAKINEKMLEKDEEEKTVVTFDIYMKYKGEDVLIARVNEDGFLEINREVLERIDPENKLGLLELGEQEKPDLDKALEGVEGKTEKELEEELEPEHGNDESIKDKAKEEGEKEKEEEEPEQPQHDRAGLLELNLGVLALVNPELRKCSKAYFDTNTNSLIFEDKSGKIYSAEECGFHELQVEGGNFALSKMDKDGNVLSSENPTKVYSIEGQRQGFGIAFDIKNYKAVNLIVKDNHEGHANSYSIIDGNLTKSDSGDISTYRASWDTGMREGIYKSGDRDKTNERAEEILDRASEETREDLQDEFAKQSPGINDENDLKEAVKRVFIPKFGEEKAEAIAHKIVYECKEPEKAVNETIDVGKEKDEDDGARTPGGDAYSRRFG